MPAPPIRTQRFAATTTQRQPARPRGREPELLAGVRGHSPQFGGVSVDIRLTVRGRLEEDNSERHTPGGA